MSPAEIKRIAEAAKGHGERILANWLPGGKRQGKEYVVLNPHRVDEHLGNLSIEVASGEGGDFAIDEKFGDFVAVVAFANQCSQSAAAETLARFLGISPTAPTGTPPSRPAAETPKSETWTPIVPVPADAPAAPRAHYVRGLPDALYTYRDSNGALLCYVRRWEAQPPNFPSKYFSPLTWCESSRGRHDWRSLGLTTPRPLYGLDTLAARLDALVVLLEGEKSADAGAKLFPDAVAMTWLNGHGSVDKADFGPLSGRNVLVWPDHDEPGAKAAVALGKALKKAGAASVSFLNPAAFARTTINVAGQLVDRLDDLPKGWDCADALVEGWTPDALAQFMRRNGVLVSAPPTLAENSAVTAETSPAPNDADNTGPFVLDDDLGVFSVRADKDGNVRQTRLCGPMKCTAVARTGDGDEWGPVIEFKDRDTKWRRDIIPYGLFVGDGTDGIKRLANLGLEIVGGRDKANLIKDYISQQQPTRRATLVDSTGWHSNAFVFPDSTIGESDETYLFRGNRRAQGIFVARGSLQDWQANIGHEAIRNPHLLFVLSVAFIGPLLKVLGEANTIFHLTGDSSIGKSGALTAAGSVWGSSDAQVHSWRNTANALEYTAAQHNDCLLILDELKEVDAKEAGPIAYMLSNAKGKGRARHDGGLRDAVTWRLAALSSGELGLGDHMASAGPECVKTGTYPGTVNLCDRH